MPFYFPPHAIFLHRLEFQEYLQDNYIIGMPRNTKGIVSFKHPVIDVTVREADYIDESLELNLERGISYAKLRPTEEKNRADSARKVSGVGQSK